jgi:hypothetical protein
LAAGDALGTTLEFKRRGSLSPIDDIVGGGPFRLAAGQWTTTPRWRCVSPRAWSRAWHSIRTIR